MREIEAQDRVFIDTSVLFPFSIMDVLLRLSEKYVFTWVWTDELLTEWEHVIVRERHRTRESAQSVTGAIRVHFADGRIDPDDYRRHITDALSPDPGDRAHVAACLDRRANILLTSNLKHYQAPILAANGVRVMSADAYLCELFSRNPVEITESFIDTAGIRHRPPVTAEHLADRVAIAGAPRFAALIKPRLSNM